MEVIGWSPNLTPDRAASAGVTYVSSKEELLKTSDIVSVHMVLSQLHKSSGSLTKPLVLRIAIPVAAIYAGPTPLSPFICAYKREIGIKYRRRELKKIHKAEGLNGFQKRIQLMPDTEC